MLQVFVDRGGTFTDLVAVTQDPTLVARCSQDPRFSVFPVPTGETVILYKLLSDNPERYQDAVIQGIRDLLGIPSHQPISAEQVSLVKMGTTVATNALLERKGDPVVLVVTQGFRDALAIGYQNRPNIFALRIEKPSLLYRQVIEAKERMSATGEILQALDQSQIRQELQRAYDQGFRSVAIALMHSYRYPQHEEQIAEIAQAIGFTQISSSAAVSPLIKYIYRGDTTVVDAYLSPLLRRYVNQVQTQLPGVNLQFMQSHGGLVAADQFQGRDAILSGPAGGIVGAVTTLLRAGFIEIITFDMGGTSTDVAHCAGEYERIWESEIAGVRMRVPSLAIHTVAAGGGSILQFDGQRYRVGPESAGANPGPMCYRRGGPLTVTDANVLLGRIQPVYFPQVFGVTGDLPIDKEAVQSGFQQLAQIIGQATGTEPTPEQVAEGFLAIAVENMGNAIKKISLQRGYDLTHYTLCCFGGAGGQVVCRLADSLGMSRIFIHAYAGVLSAYGMGLAEQRVLRAMTIEQPLNSSVLEGLETDYQQLLTQTLVTGEPSDCLGEIYRSINLKYQGTDTSLTLPFASDVSQLSEEFGQQHRQRYGFESSQSLVIESISLERVDPLQTPAEPVSLHQEQFAEVISQIRLYISDHWHQAPVYQRQQIHPQQTISGPAMILEKTGTIIVEPGWQARLGPTTADGIQPTYLLLEKCQDSGISAVAVMASKRKSDDPVRLEIVKKFHQSVNPVKLEIFKNLYQFIAEEMGIVLQNTAVSVNIKERLDFSCAIFDQQGNLVANAPHIPVHLGSMSESVKALLNQCGESLQAGDVYLSNNPYNGGTHLPDVTVITPVFDPSGTNIWFFVASRGHQADLGGITPGSMPPHSRDIRQEGILFDNQLLVRNGEFQETAIRAQLAQAPYPARNPDQNIADFKAQIAANNRGVYALQQMVNQYGLDMVQAYMGHVQDNAEQSVRSAIAALKSGQFTTAMDNGIQIQVTITVDTSARTATLDFTGTSPQGDHNFNTPTAVVEAVVLYVFRTLVSDAIPLNAGCMKPLTLMIPQGCLLNPQYPAAVVAGNVETSQAIADTIYGALGVLAASQGTMNNFTFGDGQHQYYETICGGSGAGATFAGTDAVQTHMTNSRLTDPEVLETRFPVLLEQFAIRDQSGGQGLYAGGNGVIRQLQFRQPMTASILSNRRRVAPFGLAGGQPGQPGENRLIRANGEEVILDSCSEVAMQTGDHLIIKTPGGGGFGYV